MITECATKAPSLRLPTTGANGLPLPGPTITPGSLLPPPPPLLPPPLPVPVPGSELSAWRKGLLSVETVAWVRSSWNWSWSSCWLMLALLLVVDSEDPDFHAAIHSDAVSVRLSEPPLQLSQFGQTKLAVMTPLATPLPARSVNFAADELVSSLGCECPVPRRGDNVRLPDPSWYMTYMLAPFI